MPLKTHSGVNYHSERCLGCFDVFFDLSGRPLVVSFCILHFNAMKFFLSQKDETNYINIYVRSVSLFFMTYNYDFCNEISAEPSRRFCYGESMQFTRVRYCALSITTAVCLIYLKLNWNYEREFS